MGCGGASGGDHPGQCRAGTRTTRAEGATHFLVPRKRGWPLLPRSNLILKPQPAERRIRNHFPKRFGGGASIIERHDVLVIVVAYRVTLGDPGRLVEDVVDAQVDPANAVLLRRGAEAVERFVGARLLVG